MVENIAVAESTNNLLCQDTGIPIYNVIIGRNVEFDGVAMKEAIRRGCERATTEHPLRSSVVHPLTRKNAQTSCGIGVPVINVDFDARDETVEIEMIPKGSGSENGSFLQMLIPADGIQAIKRFVIDRVIECGGRVCPPTIVGVGIGGTSDLCMHLAKVAATRPLGTSCADPDGAAIELELSEAVNELGIGPQGLRRIFHLVPRSRRDRGDAHHDESGGGEHPVPLGPPRRSDYHAGRGGFWVMTDADTATVMAEEEKGVRPSDAPAGTLLRMRVVGRVCKHPHAEEAAKPPSRTQHAVTTS